MKLLLVDDVYSNLDALEAAIDSFLGDGFTYTKSFSGQDAISKLQSQVFDLMITDLLMPFGDGYFLVEEIKNLRIKIPIIVWTGIDNIDYKRLQDGDVEFMIPRHEPIEKLMEQINLISRSKLVLHR